MLGKIDSIFVDFISSIQYIIILHETLKIAFHVGIIHDHQTKKIHGMIAVRSFIKPTTSLDILIIEYAAIIFNSMQCLQFYIKYIEDFLICHIAVAAVDANFLRFNKISSEI